MNLQGITASSVGTVTPPVLATIQQSTGYTTAADGTQVPTTTTFTNVSLQVQALEFKDIQRLDALNIQGERRAVYLQGAQWAGIIRADRKGGDLLTFQEYPGGPTHTWLAALVLEKWPDWVKLAVTLQSS